MRNLILRSLAVAVVLSLHLSPLTATCGGGGGGGTGGFATGSTGTTQTYQAPWKVVPKGGKVEAGDLVLYWFPTSPEQARASSLQTSRNLTLWAARCLSLALVTADDEGLHKQYATTGQAVVLTDRAGQELSRLAAADKDLKAGDVEKLVGAEIKKREQEVDRKLDEAAAKEKAGDADGAAALYTEVWQQRCLVPGGGKKAAKALKKLGRPVPEEEASRLGEGEPDLSAAMTAQIVEIMNAGLAAEVADRYEVARGHYEKAHKLDPADPVPLRYLGELYRHHTGEWADAQRVFRQVLAMPADPLSRAVALHGLGKMTIHGGELMKGVAMFEESIAIYPLALTYRNLAVFWNSEGQAGKASGFVKKALELDPQDPYNLIFAATYLPLEGKGEEALRIARENEGILAASYNLAAIYALTGHRDKAMELLRRHFYAYEQYDAVRAHEMKEAREDIVFLSLRKDADFVELTALAATVKAPVMRH